MKNKLAIHGGSKAISFKFKKYNTIGKEEIFSVTKVLKSGVLSEYVAENDKNFFGGAQVIEFEKAWSKFFKVKYSISVNSWTSGLTTAIGAIGIEPGDEIIVSPWTMTASAAAIIHWNAIPVFVDIDPDTFCIDPKKIEEKISKNTKAIIVVDIFGQSANMKEIINIAKKNNLKVISDSAQAPTAKYFGKYAGTLANIGGFSLNCHKHINTGEGGVLVTNDRDLAKKMRLIRNHAEVILRNSDPLINMIGHNYRMGEMEATIGIQQLKKINYFVKNRQEAAKRLTKGLRKLKGLQVPKIPKNQTHVFYIYPIKLDIEKIGVSRDKIYEALLREGVQGLMDKYQNLHLLPIYQNKIAYGSKGFPWSISQSFINYNKGICPVAEKLQDKYFIGIQMCKFKYDKKEINGIINAFKKVWLNLEKLKI
jgi:dTDP-4-amino-4,6-dideoxygalactose transaminase